MSDLQIYTEGGRSKSSGTTKKEEKNAMYIYVHGSLNKCLRFPDVSCLKKKKKTAVTNYFKKRELFPPIAVSRYKRELAIVLAI